MSSRPPLDPKRWREAERVYLAALELPEEERGPWVREACGGDEAVRSAVEAMLGAGDPGTKFLDPPTWSEPELPRVLGDFELRSVLGSGGMGTVFRARQISLEREIALKILAPHAVDARRVERFRREGLAIARLRHANIVDVHAIGTTEGAHWIAMECVDGHDLSKEIARQQALAAGKGLDGPTFLPAFSSREYFAAVAEAFARIASALDHAHQSGIVHRDLKPQNLLLAADGTPRVVDFGLAYDERMGTLSSSGELMGTPYYMSPEQARALARIVDHRTDVYSLGVVLYEALTLTRPFEGTTGIEVLRQIRRREPRSIRAVNPRVPNDLAVITTKAMAKSVRDRYATARELADDLRHFLNHEAVSARPLPGPVRVLRAVERRPLPYALVLVGLVLSVSAVFVGGRIARASRIDALTRTLRTEFEARGDAVASLPAGELRRMRLVLDDLAGEQDRESELVRDLRGRLDGYRDDRMDAARTQLESASAEAPDTSAALWARTRAASILQDVAHVFPEDGEVARLLAEASPPPRIDVRGATPTLAGRVFVREIDLFTGQPGAREPLGQLPVESFPLRPGYYRVVTETEDGTTSEQTRYVSTATPRVEVVVPPPVEPDASSMVRFDRAQFTVPIEGKGWCTTAGVAVELEPFLLDEAEVSNREYAAFLDAHPAIAPPGFWAEGTDAPNWGDLPVTGITWLEARAYAEWVGKRLPTHLEWEYAARGPEGRHFPWPEGEAPPANVDAPFVQPRDRAQTHALYLRHAAPVRSFEEARTPEGLFHVFGNVSELTESVMVIDQHGEALPRMHDRVRLGGSWRVRALNATLEQHDYTGVGPGYANFDQGFRCARSVAP